MKTLLVILVALALCAPMLGTITPDGTTHAISTQRTPNKFVIGLCGKEWVGKTCADSVGFGGETKTFVEIGESSPGADDGVCTQVEADTGAALPVQICDTTAQTQNLCPSDWPVDEVLIPKKAECVKVADWVVKAWGKARAQDGLNDLEKQRVPAAGDHDGDITDP